MCIIYINNKNIEETCATAAAADALKKNKFQIHHTPSGTQYTIYAVPFNQINSKNNK